MLMLMLGWKPEVYQRYEPRRLEREDWEVNHPLLLYNTYTILHVREKKYPPYPPVTHVGPPPAATAATHTGGPVMDVKVFSSHREGVRPEVGVCFPGLA